MLDAPPLAPDARPVLEVPHAVVGRRVVAATGGHPDDPSLVTYLRDLRAASEVFRDSGSEWIVVVSEEQWQRWTGEGSPGSRCPNGTAVLAQFVWVV